MKKFPLALLALAVALAIAPAAMADSTGINAVGSPSMPGIDLSQEWNETCPTCVGAGGIQYNSFNSIEMFVETPGIFFTDPGGISDSTWTGNVVNPQYVQLVGGNVSSLYFNTDLGPDPISTVTVDFYAMEGSLVVDSAQFTWPTSGPYGWTVGTLNPANQALENTATPEPSSLMLLGTGLFALAFVVFRKAKMSGLVLQS